MPDGTSGASGLYDCCNDLGRGLEDRTRARLELGGASRIILDEAAGLLPPRPLGA